MLVCIGAALAMMVSAYGFNEVLGRQATVLDPSRVAAQVVSGIGFLGAGIIIFRKDVVIGLTTAAGIWAIAAVGLAVGGGLYLASIATTAVIMLVIAMLRPIEARLRKSRKRPSLSVLVDRKTSMSEIEHAVLKANAALKGLKAEQVEQSSNYNVSITLDSLASNGTVAVVEELKKIPGVQRVEVEG
jgi:putative Mg2+ transporter-C (MgtC) family protein